MINEKGRIKGKLLFAFLLFMVAGTFFYTAILVAEHLPTVQIASPADGSDVSGSIDIRVQYSIDNGQVHALIFYAGGAEVEREDIGERAGTRVFHLDTSDYPPGELSILVHAYSAAPPSDHYTTAEITLNVVSSACSGDSDCDDGDDHSLDTCLNPGSPNAECSHQTIECLDDSECDDSNPLTLDGCSNPGAPAANCVHTEFACNTDADCDDSNVNTEDKCHNGGSPGSWCTNQPIACFTDEDCDDGQVNTEDKCHSPGTAAAWCTNKNIACFEDGDCDDGSVNTEDRCHSGGTSGAWCTNKSIACFTDENCDDSNDYTEDKCHSGGTSGAWCTNKNITCLTNSDCDDGDDRTEDICKNSGQVSSSCKHNDVECLNDSECDDGNPLSADSCEAPGTAQSNCIHAEIACLDNGGCDDGNAMTLDICANPGTAHASCVHDPLACSFDADCADSNPLTVDACENPGEADSACIHTAIACNSDSDCDDENDHTADVCINPGQTYAVCSNKPIGCLDDSDCDDSDGLTIDTCENPGVLGSSCKHTSIACSKDADCDDGNELTTDKCENPGETGSACSNVACEVPCGSDAGCDDGNASTNDTCENAGACQAECEHTAIEPEPEPEPVQLTLTITNPDDGLITNNPSLTVSGMTTPGAAVTVAGRPAEVSSDGTFSIGVSLNEGNNNIEINAALNEDRLSESISAVLDTKAPSVISSEPEDGAEISAVPSRIAVRIEDVPGGAGLNASAIRVFLDGDDLAGHYDTTSRSYEASIDTPASGYHILSVSASDLVGNILDRTLSFTLTGKGPQIKILKLPGEPAENSFTTATSAQTASIPTGPVETTQESGTSGAATAETPTQPLVSPSAGSVQIPQSPAGWLITGHNYRFDTIAELLKDKYPNSGWNVGDWSDVAGGGKSSTETNAAAANLLESSLSPTTTSPSLIPIQDVSGSGDIEAQIEAGGSPVDADTIQVEVDGVVVPHEYDAATKKVKSKVKGLKKGSHSAKITASGTDGATGMALSAFSISSTTDTLTLENITTPGTEIRDGDRFALRIESTSQYTPWVVLYNPDIDPVTPGAVGPCNAQYFVGDGYNLSLIDGTTYSYETNGVFYTSADRAAREASRVYAAMAVDSFDDQGNGNCLFSSESFTVTGGPVKPGLDSATFNKADDPTTRVINPGDEYTVSASGSPGIVNVDYWLLDPDQIVGNDPSVWAVESGVVTETSLGSGQYTLQTPQPLNNITPSQPGAHSARFLLAVLKPRAWNYDVPMAVSDILYIGPAPAPVFNVVEIINADHPGEPLRPGQRYKIHVQGDVDSSHIDYLKVSLINSDRFYPQWKPYYGTGLFVPGTESAYNSGLNFMDPTVYGPGVYEAEGVMPQLKDYDGQSVTNVRAIVTAASYFDYSVSSPITTEQSQQLASVENVRMGNVDHPEWTTVAASETVRVEAESDTGMNLECRVDAARFSGGETTVPVIEKTMSETQSGRYSCEDVVLSRPDIDGAPADILMAKVYSGDGSTFLYISDDFLTFRDKVTEVHFKNLSREGATDISQGERFEITAVGQSNITEEIYGSVLDAFINHSSAQQPVFQPTDRLLETQSGSGIYKIESTLATVPDGVTKIRAAIGDPNGPVKPVFSSEVLSIVPAEPPKPPEIMNVNDVEVTNGEVTSDSLAPVIAGTAEPDSTVGIYEFMEGEGTAVHSVPGGLQLSAVFTQSSGNYGYDFGSGEFDNKWSVGSTQGTWTLNESAQSNSLEMHLLPGASVVIDGRETYPYSQGFRTGYDIRFVTADVPSVEGINASLNIKGYIHHPDGSRDDINLNWGVVCYQECTSQLSVSDTIGHQCSAQGSQVVIPGETYHFELAYYSGSQPGMEAVFEGGTGRTVVSCDSGSWPDEDFNAAFNAGNSSQSSEVTFEYDTFTTDIPVPDGYLVSGPALSTATDSYDGFGTGGGLFLRPCTAESPATMPVLDGCVNGEKDIHAFLITVYDAQGDNGTVIPELKATIYSSGDPSVQGDDQESLVRDFFDSISGQYIGGYSIDGEVVALRAPTAGAPNDYDPVENLAAQEQLCRDVPGEKGSLRWDATYDNGDGTYGAYIGSNTPLAYNGDSYDEYVIWGIEKNGDGPNTIPSSVKEMPIWWATGGADVTAGAISFNGDGGTVKATAYGTADLFRELPSFGVTVLSQADGALTRPVDPKGANTPENTSDDDYGWDSGAFPEDLTLAPVGSCSGGTFKLIGETTANASGTFATQVISFQAAGDHVITAKSTKNDFTTKWSDPVIYHLQTGEPADTTPPSISFASYSDGECLNNTQPAITVSISDAGSGVDWPGVKCSTSVGVSCSITRSGDTAEAEISFGSALPESVVSITVEADDLANPKNHAEKSISLHIDVTPPLPFSTPPQAWPEPGIEGENDDDPEIFLTYSETSDYPGGCGIAAYYTSVAADPADCINASATITTPGEQSINGFEGLDYYCIAAVDRAGNRVATSDSITIDLTLPVISTPIASPNPFSPNGDDINESTLITASVTDTNLDAWKVELVDTGLPIAGGTSSAVIAPWNGGGLNDDVYDYRVSAVDLAGNYSEATASVAIDTIAPTVSITNPGSTEKINPASYTLQAEASDISGIAYVEFFLNDSKIDFATETAPGIYSLTYDFEPLKKQWVTFDAKATDNAGNTNSNTILFFVQNKPKTVQSLQVENLTRPGATDISAGEIFLATAVLSGKDDSLEVRIGNASRLSPWPPQNTSDPFIQFSLIQGKWKGGTYTLKGVLLATNDGNGIAASSISAVASLDNYTTISVSPSFAVVPDTTPPPPPEISKPKDGAKSANTTPDIAGTAEPLSNITFYLKGSPDIPVAFAVTGENGKFTTTSDSLSPAGLKQLYAVAQDGAGNTSDPSAIVNYTLKDTTNPVIKDVSDAPDPFSPCPDPALATCASHGSKDTVEIKADVYDETPRKWLVRIFNSADTLVLKYPEDFDLPTDPIGPNPLSFIWDGDKPRKNKPPLPQPEGTYRYELQAVDFSGRKSDWATGTVNIDKTAPTASITSPANGAVIYDSSMTVAISASDNIAVDYVVVSVDGNEIGTATAPVAANQYEYVVSAPDLGPGEHAIGAVAWDVAGNWSATDTVQVQLDAEPPVLSAATASEKIISPAISPEVKDSVTFSGVAVDKNLALWSIEIMDASGTVEFMHEEPFVSPQPYVPATFTYTWNGKNTSETAFLTDGEYTWLMKAFDAVGNSAAATGTIAIDNTPPGAVITAPDAGDIVGGVARDVLIDTSDVSEVVSLSLFMDDAPDSQAVRIATSTWQATIYPHIYGDGPHTIGAVATDIAGNPSATATVNITIETIAPNPPINLTSTDNPDGSVTLTWEPPTTNVDGSPLTDLAGYNIYKVTEVNRCEDIYPVQYDTTPVVCEPAGGGYTINGPTLHFGDTDYNNTPFGALALWLDLTNPNSAPLPLPAEIPGIDQAKPVFAYTVHITITPRAGDVTPGPYDLTLYTQASQYELEQWLTMAATFGIFEGDFRITAHATACRPDILSPGIFIQSNIPLKSIPEFEYEILNDCEETCTIYVISGDTIPSGAFFSAVAVDLASNRSENSNISVSDE